MWNQISTPNFTYQNDERNKIYTLRDSEDKTPTHMDATHAISKSERDFQNRIPRELNKKFYIPRFVVIHWITSTNGRCLVQKSASKKVLIFQKVISDYVNLTDFGDIKFFVQFPENSIMKTSLRFWNCVGCGHMRGCFILKFTQCVNLFTLVILICEIAGTYLISS